MISTTRREALLGVLAVPVAARVPRRRSSGTFLVVFDPTLAAGRRVAEVYDRELMPIEGDRIRFARKVFARRPAMVTGVSRPADAMLIEEVGREAGYVPVEVEDAVLQQIIDAARPRDGGLVLGWVLAPR